MADVMRVCQLFTGEETICEIYKLKVVRAITGLNDMSLMLANGKSVATFISLWCDSRLKVVDAKFAAPEAEIDKDTLVCLEKLGNFDSLGEWKRSVPSGFVPGLPDVDIAPLQSAYSEGIGSQTAVMYGSLCKEESTHMSDAYKQAVVVVSGNDSKDRVLGNNSMSRFAIFLFLFFYALCLGGEVGQLLGTSIVALRCSTYFIFL